MKILLILHGFLGFTDMMKEIEESFHSEYKYFDHIWNLTYYDSPSGLDLNQPFNIGTSVFEEESKISLVENLYVKLLKDINLLNSSEKIDIIVIAHSLGGLVIRALIKYKCTFKANKQWVNENCSISSIFLLGPPNHGTYIADKWVVIPAETLIELLTKLLNIYDPGLKKSHIVNKSQMSQMETGSEFLRHLNREESIKGCRVYTFRGSANKTDFFSIIFQPIFLKFWYDCNFPWLHFREIKNDGIVQAKSVPLKGKNIQNFLIENSNHINLIEWKTNPAGKIIKEIIT